MSLAGLDRQAAFDRVARHLLRQGRKSMSGVVCAYRGSDNTSCAVGCLIDDADYDPSIEGIGIHTLLVGSEFRAADQKRLARIFEGVPEDTLELLEELQSVHDDCEPSNWRARLGEVAKSNGLSDAVLWEDRR